MNWEMIMKDVRSWIYRNARPLDLARWQYHFEDGKKENVIAMLSEYQNEDGGFAYALEADTWNPNSAPMQTYRAVELLLEIELIDQKAPLIQGMLKYLGSGKDVKEGLWRNRIESNNEYPHAPWWHQDDESKGHDRYIPSAGLAGFVLYYGDQESSIYKRCAAIVKEAAEYVLKVEELDMHVMRCFITMAEFCEKAGITELFSSEALKAKLKKLVNNSITQDVTIWATSYICKPSQFFKMPDSIFYPDNKEMVAKEIEFILNNRNQAGVWEVTWSWDAYPEEWAITKNWWKAGMVIDNMLFLRNLG